LCTETNHLLTDFALDKSLHDLIKPDMHEQMKPSMKEHSAWRYSGLGKLGSDADNQAKVGRLPAYMVDRNHLLQQTWANSF